ncbi:hypothetical protein M0R45_010465 [Rubus argutus]|uniref:Uncharacterized protein n=1 Tax=Rubus argutus TaxID=59490 RepID=A0AAW1YA80_RUBAR
MAPLRSLFHNSKPQSPTNPSKPVATLITHHRRAKMMPRPPLLLSCRFLAPLPVPSRRRHHRPQPVLCRRSLSPVGNSLARHQPLTSSALQDSHHPSLCRKEWLE